MHYCHKSPDSVVLINVKFLTFWQTRFILLLQLSKDGWSPFQDLMFGLDSNAAPDAGFIYDKNGFFGYKVFECHFNSETFKWLHCNVVSCTKYVDFYLLLSHLV
jgi:hypothetical protein